MPPPEYAAPSGLPADLRSAAGALLDELARRVNLTGGRPGVMFQGSTEQMAALAACAEAFATAAVADHLASIDDRLADISDSLRDLTGRPNRD